jgi:hypothetical protein
MRSRWTRWNHTVRCLLEAVVRVMMRRVDVYWMSQRLKAKGGVNDQTFGPTSRKTRQRE